MIFSIEERKDNDLIVKTATGNTKTRTIRDLLFSQTVQAVHLHLHLLVPALGKVPF